ARERALAGVAEASTERARSLESAVLHPRAARPGTLGGPDRAAGAADTPDLRAPRRPLHGPTHPGKALYGLLAGARGRSRRGDANGGGSPLRWTGEGCMSVGRDPYSPRRISRTCGGAYLRYVGKTIEGICKSWTTELCVA